MINGDFPIPVHPGDLLQDILDAAGITQSELARHLHIFPSKINEVCCRRRGISAEMAFRLGRAFGQSPQFWMNAQANWELSQVEKGKYLRVKKLKIRTRIEGAEAA